MGPFRIGKNRTLPDWQIWDSSGLVKMGPFRIGENWDPSGLVKMGPFRIGENWDPSGLNPSRLVKMGPFRIVAIGFSVSESIMLNELTRKGVFRP